MNQSITSIMMLDIKKPVVDFAVRDKLRHDFLLANGLANEQFVPLASDASFRRYFRLVGKKLFDKNCLVMDSPPDLYPTIVFERVADMLTPLHTTRVAKIFARDHDNGFLLLEDLGAASLTKVLATQLGARAAAKTISEEEIYKQVIAGLVRTQMAWHDYYLPSAQSIAKQPLPDYDGMVLAREAILLPQWYVPEKNHITPDATSIKRFVQLLLEIYHQLLADHAAPCAVFVHRDFHVDNLLLVGNPGDDNKSIAWLDFQDGLIGHPTYDVMSLLEDARRDITAAVKQTLWQDFLAAWQKKFPDNKKLTDDFLRWFYFQGLTRHAKVLGIFVRLEKRDGKKNYHQHLSRVLTLLRSSMHGLLVITENDHHGGGMQMATAVKELQNMLQRWRLL